MKNFVLELAFSKEGINAKLNIMREYIQAYILRVLYEDRFFRNTVFLGGTALRFLYNLPRFSQDLDFSLIKKRNYSFISTIKNIKQELNLAGYDISIEYKDKDTVHYAMLKFKKLLYEAKLSPLPEENFSIKIEVDTNPPKGAHIENQIVNKYFLLSFLTYDLSTLFAGKLHAILSRKYTKGRDFFDLGWYLSKWKDLTPNIIFLTNALRQTNWKGQYPNINNWQSYLAMIVDKTNWNTVEKDVESFLENSSDIRIINKKNLTALIK